MATIKQVADLAGVSVGTVSHVITGSVRVSEPLRRKVQAAIRRLDYHPNHVARSLKTSKTRTLGIIVPDMTISFYPQVIRGAESAAREQDYSLIAVNSDDDVDRQESLFSLLRSQRIEGLLLVIASGVAPAKQIQRLRAAGIPVVCLDRIPDKCPVDTVSVDDVKAAELGVSHLISAGFRRIAVMTGPLSLRNERRRLLGYKKALQQQGIPVDDKLIWTASLHRDQVAAACREYLQDAHARPDAIFATNGQTGLGILHGFHDMGINTPGDIGFATFDELSLDDLFTPAVTTVVQPAFDIGFRASEILLQRISEHTPAKHAGVVSLRLPAALKVRASSQRRHQQGIQSLTA